MSEYKKRTKINQYAFNPFFNDTRRAEFYDDSRDDQGEESDVFVKLSHGELNKNVYELYKSFFYRYQDYNQINR